MVLRYSIDVTLWRVVTREAFRAFAVLSVSEVSEIQGACYADAVIHCHDFIDGAGRDLFGQCQDCFIGRFQFYRLFDQPIDFPGPRIAECFPFPSSELLFIHPVIVATR